MQPTLAEALDRKAKGAKLQKDFESMSLLDCLVESTDGLCLSQVDTLCPVQRLLQIRRSFEMNSSISWLLVEIRYVPWYHSAQTKLKEDTNIGLSSANFRSVYDV